MRMGHLCAVSLCLSQLLSRIESQLSIDVESSGDRILSSQNLNIL